MFNIYLLICGNVKFALLIDYEYIYKSNTIVQLMHTNYKILRLLK